MNDDPTPLAVLTDIEGTTTPIAFVSTILFPYARAALPGLLADKASKPEIADCIAQIAQLAPDADPLLQCLAWMDQDAKIKPLKTLQGIAWQHGFASGALRTQLYADVAPSLRRWHASGVRLGIYSSGSAAAQKLVFGASTPPGAGDDGDLTGLFEVFLDTSIGSKREPRSYTSAASALGLQPGCVLFLSDSAAELDAAASAGMRTCQLVRPQDGTIAATNHPNEPDFGRVGARFALPDAALA